PRNWKTKQLLNITRHFQVKEQDGDLIINTTEKQLESTRRTPLCGIKSLSNETSHHSGWWRCQLVFLCGARSTEWLYDPDHDDQYGREPTLRSSKAQQAVEVQEVRMRPDEYYKENHIDLMMKTKVTKVDPNRRNITLETGEQLPYSKLVLALGGTPKKLSIPGADLKNVFTLRVVSDANSIAAQSEGKQVVCIGSSFIG
ncbi:hypothetical protein COOONC_25407, partial [Cooperia oncophora]